MRKVWRRFEKEKARRARDLERAAVLELLLLQLGEQESGVVERVATPPPVYQP